MHKNHLVRVQKTSRCVLNNLFWSSDHILRWSDFLWKIEGFGRHKNGWKYPEVSRTVVGHLAAFPLNAGLSLVLEFSRCGIETFTWSGNKQLSHYGVSKFFLLFPLQRQLVQFPFSLKVSKTVMTIKQYYLFISVLTVPLFSGLTQQQHPSLLPMTQLLRGGIPRRSHTRCDIWTLQHVSWSSLYFVFSQLVQIIATGRRHEQMSPPAQLFPVNKRKYWFLHYLFIS